MLYRDYLYNTADFIRFLAENEAINNYLLEFDYYDSELSPGVVVANFFGQAKPDRYISGAFFWDKTAQGFDYWRRLDDLWTQRLLDRKRRLNRK